MIHLRAPRFGGQVRGFSLVELLVALTISLLVSAALAATVPPARAAFEHTPAALDVQQRRRTIVDALTQAVRSAGIEDFVPPVVLSEPDPDGSRFSRLLTITRRMSGAEGTLEFDQEGESGELVLAASPCPGVPEVCGFTRGATAVIADGTGRFEIFTIASTNRADHSVSGMTALTSAYPAGAIVVEVDASVFRLDAHGDGSTTLVRETRAGAVQPIVDRVGDLWLRVTGSRLEVETMLDRTPVRVSIAMRNAS